MPRNWAAAEGILKGPNRVHPPTRVINIAGQASSRPSHERSVDRSLE